MYYTFYHTIPNFSMVVECEQCKNGAIGGKEWIEKVISVKRVGEKGTTRRKSQHFT